MFNTLLDACIFIVATSAVTYLVHISPYPLRDGSWERQYAMLHACACGVYIAVIVSASIHGARPSYLVLYSAAVAVYIYKLARKYLVVSLYYGSGWRAISAWRAWLSTMYYLRAGHVFVHVYRQKRTDVYRLLIEHPNEGTLLHRRIKPDGVDRLLHMMVSHYPYPTPLRSGWAVSAISVWSRGFGRTYTAKHRICPAWGLRGREATLAAVRAARS